MDINETIGEWSQLQLVAAGLLTGLLLGALIGVIAATSYFRPSVLGMVLKLKSAVFIAIGVGLIVWPITSLAFGETFQTPVAAWNWLRTPAECLGWGAGFLTLGVTKLVLGCVLGSGAPR